MAFKPAIKKLDYYQSDLDQVQIGDADTYFKWVAPDTVELYVNGVLRQSWTTAVVVGTGRHASMWGLMPNLV
jgi:hypothetical protein